MKKTLKGLFSILLAFSLVCSMGGFALANYENPADCGLSFNDDGKFVILQFADVQDDIFMRVATIMEMEYALDTVKPDLVVFTGDNTTGQWTKITGRIAIERLLAPVVERGVKFTFVFGNHDGERLSKEYQLSVYQSFEGCLAYDPDHNIFGCANHNLEIKSSDLSKTVFNLWMIDSNMDSKALDSYEPINKSQLDWYRTTSERLEAENGELVPSLVFQHIPVPQTYDLLLEAPEGTTEETREFNGKTYIKQLDPQRATGILGEWPCVTKYSQNELTTFAERGDVLGIVTGHDHNNNFIGNVDGIDLIQSPGIGFQAYGTRDRGYRVITLDENDPWSYETYTVDFTDMFGEGPEADFIYNVYGGPFGIIVKAIFDFVKGLAGSLGFSL
jgi:predicted phosphodiesterase